MPPPLTLLARIGDLVIDLPSPHSHPHEALSDAVNFIRDQFLHSGEQSAELWTEADGMLWRIEQA